MKIECRSCQATGLYRGFAEPEGYAVVCHTCRGQGFEDVQILDKNASFAEFTRRKRKRGINKVLTDGGMWFTRGRTDEAPSIDIEDFYDGDSTLRGAL